ncbi:hypothetical protein GWI33_012101 [Rhynchophorus ferrugineus]|uniref:Tudor domain-containing protein n=1 Tax=Rhynchophorus ferrugineus TaxID=354439 RepID=A0A834M923_RHYFE|nr:hypothetical protein GWI33_012101 [Rhynchophorus ferrugineus]
MSSIYNKKCLIQLNTEFCDMEDEDMCIPNSFVKNPWVVNNIYRLKVSYINSPSEFWIVTKDQELGKFHGDLNSFYSRNKSYLKADFRNINLEGNCVVYTGECYCRANLLNVSSSVKNQKSLDAFLIDYGSTIRVTSDDVYFLTKEMYSVPQFAVKASLKGLRPSESSTWSPAAVDTFTKLVEHKVLLGQLRGIDRIYQILYLDLLNYNDDYEHTVSISRMLILNNSAKLSLTLSYNGEKRYNQREVNILRDLLDCLSSINQDLNRIKPSTDNFVRDLALKYQNIRESAIVLYKRIN